MYFMSTALVAEMLAAPRTEREAHAAVAPFAGRPNKSREDAEMIRPWEVRRRLPQRRSRPVTSRSATSPRVCAQDVYTGLSLAREVGAAELAFIHLGCAPFTQSWGRALVARAAPAAGTARLLCRETCMI